MAEVTTREVRVPNIGDFTDVPVVEVLVAVGDHVAAEDSLIALESEKATMEVPSPAEGEVAELAVKVGDHLSEGDLILKLTVNDADVSAGSGDISPDETTTPSAPPTAADDDRPAPSSPAAGADDAAHTAVGPPPYASPGARRLARELQVDLAALTGSGRKGRITKDDIRTAAQSPAPAGAGAPATPSEAGAGLDLPAWPQVDHAAFGPIERVPLTRIQRIAGPALARNWVMIPHVTQHDQADITELEEFRTQINAEHADDGVKVTMVSLLIVACAAALREFPTFNSSLDGQELVLKHYTNIGFAVDTPNGLLVPVIRDADRKGLIAIARELTTLSGAAREGTIGPDALRAGTFTITSLGGIGGTHFTPIINASEVAILGVSRSQIAPVWDGEQFRPRLMLPLSLSYDHRVIDGAAAARFTTHLARLLSDPRRMLL